MILKALVLVFEMDRVRGLPRALLQVPNLEVFLFVNREEFTETSGKSCFVWTVVGFALSLLCSFRFLEVQLAPFDLGNGGCALMIPYCNGSSEPVIIQTKTNK